MDSIDYSRGGQHPMSTTSFQNWLKQVTLPYVYSSQVCKEVDSTLRQFHNLRPQSSHYTLYDGLQATLLNLVGTIPVMSQQNEGRVIDVPVEICLPLHFPAELPIIWIRPNFLKSGGSIVMRQTENVDVNGMVWGIESLRGLMLVEIIVNLQNIFGYQLPIVSAVLTTNDNQQEYLGGSVGRERTKSPLIDSGTVMSGTANSSDTNHYNNTTPSNASNNNHMSDREKLKKKVVEEIENKIKKFDEEIGKLKEIKMKLIEGENVLNREKLTLNNEINLLNKEIDILNMKRTEMERFISNNSGETVQRSATTPTDPASSQLLELLANETALMDVLYQLIKVTVTPVNGENRVPLNTSLRCIRELSRKHFLTKAHIRKIT